MNLAWVDLADYLTIAGAVLGIDPGALLRHTDLHLAESALAAPAASYGGIEFCPAFHTKVAVLGWHLVKNHPLPDGNKRAAFLTMVEFVERNGFEWVAPSGDAETDGDETVGVIEGTAAGKISVEDLADWVKARSRGTGPQWTSK